MNSLRKRLWMTCAVLGCLGLMWYGATGCGSTATDGGAVVLYLQSNDIPGTSIASTFVRAACGGDDLSPQLFWNYVPGNGLSLAVTVLDDDANDFVHWILYNIPTDILELARGTAPPAGSTEATNDYGEVGYGGPCPPSGAVHFYKFKLWVLNIADLSTADGFDPNNNDTILQALSDHEVRTDEFQSAYRAP